jgi:hypothetical protein
VKVVAVPEPPASAGDEGDAVMIPKIDAAVAAEEA